jgi:hypothetical protein
MMNETPTRRCAPTSPFQGEVRELAAWAEFRDTRRLRHLPLQGGGIGGLRPPFRTPTRSVGYVAQQTGWGSR